MIIEGPRDDYTVITQARRRHPIAQEARAGCRRAEKLPASLQLDIRVKWWREWSHHDFLHTVK